MNSGVAFGADRARAGHGAGEGLGSWGWVGVDGTGGRPPIVLRVGPDLTALGIARENGDAYNGEPVGGR